MMGQLVDGKWVTDAEAAAADGRFRRAETTFRNWVTADGAAGPTGEGGFPAEPGRYHLYVAAACPWAHRTRIFRVLKKLEGIVSLSQVETILDEYGWAFSDAQPDPIGHHARLYEVYAAALPTYSGRASVPVLWDKQRQTIVSNESSEIIRMFNSAFDGVGGDAAVDFYPPSLRAGIDEINAVIYATVNDGVYRSGFARTQSAYEAAATALFNTLDMLEERLASRRYLMGERLTEADWRLFTTLVRFDAVYFTHFKCNLHRLADYTNLSGYMRELYQMPGIAGTFDVAATREHYYRSHRSINPFGIIPIGPVLDFASPHGRSRLKAAA